MTHIQLCQRRNSTKKTLFHGIYAFMDHGFILINKMNMLYTKTFIELYLTVIETTRVLLQNLTFTCKIHYFNYVYTRVAS